MKALVRKGKGKNFSNTVLQDLPQPQPAAGEIVVEVSSSRVNPVDLQMMKRMPMVKYKKPQIGGVDGAGVVLKTGTGVSRFKAGDKVMFYRSFMDFGTWAEQISIKEEYCAKVPDNLSLRQAGALPLILMTAYEGIDALPARKGDSILIHGAAGGVGFCAVQIAQQRGLEIIGTASQKDHAFLKENGVNRLIDYRKEDFSQVLPIQGVDYIFDTIGDDNLLKSIALEPKAVTSAKLMDPSILDKSGIKIHPIFKWMMKWGIAKYVKKARKLNVKLQAVAAIPSGDRLQKVVDEVAAYLKPRNYDYLPIAEASTATLNEKSIGKVLIINE